MVHRVRITVSREFRPSIFPSFWEPGLQTAYVGPRVLGREYSDDARELPNLSHSLPNVEHF